MFDENQLQRIRMAQRMSYKLATHRSKKRTIRKLPQSMIVVPTTGLKRAYPGREALNRNKRLVYILLLGVVICAYVYDADSTTLVHMLDLVVPQG